MCHGEPVQIATGPPAPAPGPADVDAARLVTTLQADARPRLTWYGAEGDRVELTGRVLAQWVAKTSHLLLEEGEVGPGSRVQVLLGPDWRAPVFWLAAWYLGATVVTDDDTDPPQRADVVVVPEGSRAPRATSMTVVVAAAALPDPVRDLPPGSVDYGAEVSGMPDQLPAPGPATVLRLQLDGQRRVLLGPGTAAERVAAVWASGGSVVLHTGLAPVVLDRVVRQENVEPA